MDDDGAVTSPLAGNPQFVPAWDVYRDKDGKPVTITRERVHAIWHAIRIVSRCGNHRITTRCGMVSSALTSKRAACSAGC
jgi:hypothetical protein